MANSSNKMGGSDTSTGLASQEGGEGPRVLSLNQNTASVAATRVYPSMTTRQTTHANEHSAAPDTELSKTKKKCHPAPTNRSAKAQLRDLLKLGFNGFEDVDMDFWEPKLLDESQHSYKARRQKESAKMKEFIQEQKKKRKKENNAVEEDEDSCSEVSGLSDDDDNLQILALQAENRTLGARVEELSKKCKTLDKQLEVERSAKLAAQNKLRKTGEAPATPPLSETLKEVANLTQKHSSLCIELEKEKQLRLALQEDLEQVRKENAQLRIDMSVLRKPNSSAQEVNVNSSAPSAFYIEEIVRAVEATLVARIQPIIQRVIQAQSLTPAAVSSPVRPNDEPGEGEFQIPRNQRRKKERKRIRSHNLRVDIEAANEHMAAQNTSSIPNSSQLLATQNSRSSELLCTFDRTREKLKQKKPAVRSNQKGRDPASEGAVDRPHSQPPRQQTANSKLSRPASQIPAVSREHGVAARIKTDKILVFPSDTPTLAESRAEDTKQRVTQILRMHKIRPSQSGIRNIVEFVSGAALLIVDREKADLLRELLPNLGLRIKGEPIPRCHTFRIHQISEEDSIEEITRDIVECLGTAPIRVTKVPYRDPKNSGIVMAVVECDSTLFDAAARRSTILIGFTRCRIDTRLILMRCSQCRVFGHTKNNCPGILEHVMKMSKENPEECLDCLVHNDRQRTAGLLPLHKRNTRHPAGSKACRSVQALRKKFTNARRTGNNNQEEVVTGS